MRSKNQGTFCTVTFTAFGLSCFKISPAENMYACVSRTRVVSQYNDRDRVSFGRTSHAFWYT